jgi:YVTN family beta-propeller protein
MRLIKLLLIFFILVGCKKKEVESNDVPISMLKTGFLVLNEGLFNLNNATISFVNLSNNTISDDIFSQKNGRKLGDTGNDMQRYGAKVYVLVNVSSTIEVLNAHTGQSLKQIVMQENGKAKQPRNLAFYGGKVFVSCFDGYVDVIDTASLTVEKRIKVGSNPEDMVVVNQRLYVSNSGGLIPSLDSTLSIIDCQNLVELEKIVVGKNPGKIVSQNDSVLYVHVRGNYSTIPSVLKKVNVGISKNQETIPIKISGIEKMENQLLIYTSESVSLYDMKTNATINSDFIPLNDITTFYRIQYIEALKQLFLFDANTYTNSGYIHRFSNTGQYIQKYHVGLNPNSLIYYE